MTNRAILGPGVFDDVPFHIHEFNDISGELVVSEAQITSLSADKITSGTINAHTIVIDTGGVLKSADFVTGPAGAGWQLSAGLAEFNNVTVRGAIFSGAGSDIDWTHVTSVSVTNADIVSLAAGKITAGTINAEVIELGTAGGSGVLKSSNYVAGTTGWAIDGDGTAEFDNVIVRGFIEGTSVTGIINFDTGGVFRTASSGQRIEITDVNNDRIEFYTGNGAETDPSTIEAFSLSDQFYLILTGPDSGPISIRPSIRLDGKSGKLFLNGGGQDVDVDFGTETVEFRAAGSVEFGGIPLTGVTNISGVGNLGLDGGTGAVIIGNSDQLVINGGSIAFATGELDTKIYRSAADTIAFDTGGSVAVKINASQQLIVDDGSSSAPGVTFASEGALNSGFYWIGENQLGVTVGAALRAAFTTTEVQARGDAGVHFVDYNPAANGTIDAQWSNSGGNVRTLEEVSSMLSGKQDVVPLADFMDTSKILDIDLIAYHMKTDPDGPMQIGTVAASVGKLLPALAYKRGGRWDFGQYSRLVVPLIAEVRKLRDRTEQLEDRIDALEALAA